MTRKILFLSLLSLVLSICTSVVCFANTNSDTVTLGNEVSSSLERGMDTVTDAAGSVMNGGARLMQDGANTMDNMFNNNNGNNIDNMGRDDNDYYTNGYNTNGYNTVRTTEETTLNNRNDMSTTTWMWIIFALAAIIIVAAIWYYATQGNDRD
ncbi:MAG: hypothetical protein IKM97_03225 [Clostridia bacterium]|nr:hypothetical protein [Clostridia bacterium]